ncbi:PLP-dependent aminotransferase family protein [Globicatella sanguinis]|uniref:MocR-like pyridoxine biosynthesis transcription factor PdxR n=1 Tax=Globicatella sanguinis TaxID=13076 RepID=UPI002542B479|nr:PLP-dependent aminotransferase family protein [Globicatella sanguinis]MDK7629809.1 PLP-dependent aminotransferase family protein [Globicatella sanguinis]WIK67266.1 PLP-dependent aminotransferase family protein [Globicatella sanguinis]WKT56671.1 PLP-dependent aminotransferase family protein [Globicatella sanguinis]
MITVNFNEDQHLYLQIVDEVIRQIAQGHLKSGDQLPSRRALAEHLKVSLNTVINAYDQLTDEGYIVPKERSGYYVDLLEIDMLPSEEIETTPLKHEDSIISKARQYTYDFHFANRDMATLNPKQLLQYAPEALAKSVANCNLKDDLGAFSLRLAIADYLRKYRGVMTSPDNIIITGGHTASLQALFALLEDGIYALEDPGYYKNLDLFTDYQQKTIRIPIDKYGFSVKDLETTSANIVITTPNHQFPTGIIMGMRRRQRLLKWAYQAENRYIIENDYYNEFRLKGRPVPALTSLDDQGRVILLGAFRQSMGSIFKLSYLVLPNQLMKKFHQAKLKTNDISSFEQYLMTDFLNSAYFPKYINSLRTNYRRKEKAVLAALHQTQLPLTIKEAGAGLFFIITFEGEIPPTDVIQARLAANKIRLQPVNHYAQLKNRFDKSYILGYGGLELDEIDQAIQALVTIFK